MRRLASTARFESSSFSRHDLAPWIDFPAKESRRAFTACFKSWGTRPQAARAQERSLALGQNDGNARVRISLMPRPGFNDKVCIPSETCFGRKKELSWALWAYLNPVRRGVIR